VLLEKAKSDHLYTCVFEDYVDNIPQRKTLLDHILVTPEVAKMALQAGVSHDIFCRYSSGVFLEIRRRKRCIVITVVMSFIFVDTCCFISS
jgi:hypothetical protein